MYENTDIENIRLKKLAGNHDKKIWNFNNLREAR